MVSRSTKSKFKKKLIRKETAIENDELDYNRETEALAEYEIHFKSKMLGFEAELGDLKSLEDYL